MKNFASKNPSNSSVDNVVAANSKTMSLVEN